MPAPASDARERRVGLACALALIVVWAGFILAGRLSAKQALTAWDATALRHGGSLLFILPLIAIRGLPRLGLRRGVALVGTAGFGFPLLAYCGFAFAPAAHGAVMMPGTLAFQTAALAAVVLREPWTRRRALALAVVAGGIVLLASDTLRDHPGAWRGDLLFLLASLHWAVFTVLLRRWRVPALDATVTVAFWPAVFFLPVWFLALPTNLPAVPWGAIAFQFAWQGGMAVIVAGFLFARAVVALGPGPTTTITAVVPALAALGAWPLLDEPLGAAGLVGVGLVCAGMGLGVAATCPSSPTSSPAGAVPAPLSAAPPVSPPAGTH